MSFAAMCAIASSKHNAALTCGDPEYGFVALALKVSVPKQHRGFKSLRFRSSEAVSWFTWARP